MERHDRVRAYAVSALARHKTAAWGVASSAVVAALVIAHLYRIWTIRDFMVDDAFISLRYARNLARGWGLSFNFGEHTEGFTNLSLVLIEAIPFRLGFKDPAWMPNVVGAISSAIAIVCLWRAAYGLHADPVAALAAPVVLTSSLSFSVWSVGGLETALFLALVSLALCRHIIETGDRRSLPIAPFVACLAIMTRPEGAWFALVLAAHATWEAVHERHVRRALPWLLVLSGFGVLFVLWKQYYFGQVLPITWYAKGTETVSPGILREGFGRLLDFLTFDIGYVALVAIPFALLVRDTRRRLPLLGVIVVGYLVFVVRQGGTTVVGNFFRLYVPALAPIALLVSLGFAAIRRLANDHTSRQVAIGVAMSGWFVATYVAGFTNFSTAVSKSITLGSVWGADGPIAGSRAHLEAGHVAVGRWFYEHSDPTARIVVWDAGAIPYYADRVVLDSWSLNDIDIALMKRERVSAQEIAEFILFQAPDYYVMPTYGITSSALFQQNYRPRPDASSSGYYYALDTFERKYPVLLERVTVDANGVLRPTMKPSEGLVSTPFVPIDPSTRFTYAEALSLVQRRAREYLGRELGDNEITNLKETYGDAGPNGVYTGDGLNIVLRELHHRGLIRSPGIGYLYSRIHPFTECADPFTALGMRPAADLQIDTEIRFGPTPWVRLNRWSSWRPAEDALRMRGAKSDLWMQCRTAIAVREPGRHR